MGKNLKEWIGSSGEEDDVTKKVVGEGQCGATEACATKYNLPIVRRWETRRREECYFCFFSKKIRMGREIEYFCRCSEI